MTQQALGVPREILAGGAAQLPRAPFLRSVPVLVAHCRSMQLALKTRFHRFQAGNRRFVRPQLRNMAQAVSMSRFETAPLNKVYESMASRLEVSRWGHMGRGEAGWAFDLGESCRQQLRNARMAVSPSLHTNQIVKKRLNRPLSLAEKV